VPFALENVISFDMLSAPVHLLVNHGFVETNFCPGDTQSQVAFCIQFQRVHTFEPDDDLVRIHSGRDHEVEFQLRVVTVINQIDARIDVFIFYFGVRGDVRAPLPRVVPDEVICDAGQFVHALDARRRVCPCERHPEQSRSLGTRRTRPLAITRFIRRVLRQAAGIAASGLETQHRFVGPQNQCVTIAA
jgi:hypothetical protein